MTNIDDSNTTPPGYWFGELNGRLRDRMRHELHDLDLGRRGWRILHALADGPATAEDLAAALPRHGRRGGPRRADLGAEPHRHGTEHRQGEPAGAGDGGGDDAAEASARRDWRGHPDWMRRDWERRQDMYRAWMQHDREHPHPEQHDHAHGHAHDHDPHAGGHGHHEAFERGFERGFVRGFERGTPSRAGRFGHGLHGPGHGRAQYAGRSGCGDHLRGGVDRILTDFVERGWVWFDGDAATLTDEGQAAHDAAFERIRAVRASVTDGIDPADLATTMATLEAMARNLGWSPDERAAAADAEPGSDDPTSD